MIPLNTDQLLQQIRKDWDKNPFETLACEAILDQLMGETEDRFDIQRVTNSLAVAQVELLKALQYLIGDRTHLLEMCFEFIEDGKVYPLSHTEIRIVRDQGVFLHPTEREPVQDFDDKIFMYFCASLEVKKLRGDFELQFQAVRSALASFLSYQTDYRRKDVCAKLFVRRWAIVHGAKIADRDNGIVWCDRGDLV